MDARRSQTLRRFPALLLLVAALAGCGDATAPLKPGTRFPLAGENASAAGMEVVWVLRAEDFLTCQASANGVRAFQRRFGHVRLSVLYVGDSHEDWVQGFLRRQRIEAPVTRLSEEEFQRSFRARPAPWLYLLRDGVVHDVLPGIGPVDAVGRWTRIARAVRG